MVKLKHTTNPVYQTAYPLVWRPRYRRAVLHEPVKSTLEDLFAEICRQKGMDLIAAHVEKDPIHLFASWPPALSIADAVKLLKGISARKLRMMFPDLKKTVRSNRLCAPGYDAGAAGQVSAQTIEHDIANQEKHHAK